MKLIVTKLFQIAGTESNTEFITGISGWWKISIPSLFQGQDLEV